MAEEFDPAGLFDSKARVGGIRKMCTDHKRCGLGISCEHAQVRNEACEMKPMWEPDGADNKSCRNWTPRKELCSEGDIFRGKGHKHNQLRRSNPVVTTKRHIRNGDDIA